MRYTLLDMTQDILSAMDSDEVNSISDSSEALQVARVIRTAYFDLVSRLDLPEHKTVFQLNTSGSSLYPVIMSRPQDVQTIEFIKYNHATLADTDPNFVLLEPVAIDEFFDRMHSYSSSATEVDSFTYNIDGTNTLIMYYNDRHPSFYTCVNDSIYIFDAIDTDVESLLQASRTFCFGLKEQSFSMTDSFIPDLDEQHFALLLNEAKALAFAEMKQLTHNKAEKSSLRHQVAIHKNKHHHDMARTYYDTFPNYGRK